MANPTGNRSDILTLGTSPTSVADLRHLAFKEDDWPAYPLAHRNPTFSFRLSGMLLLRFAARVLFSLLPHDPPLESVDIPAHPAMALIQRRVCTLALTTGKTGDECYTYSDKQRPSVICRNHLPGSYVAPFWTG